jgi:hypothetical protein
MVLTLLAVSVLSLMLPQVSVRQSAASDARIAGQVVDADSHAPVAGARVSLMMSITVEGGTFGVGPREAVTDASGQFTFRGVAEGRYRLDVQKPGFAPSADPLDPQALDVAAGQSITGLQVALKKAGVIAGRIVDAGGEPLAEVSVTALRRVETADPSGIEMPLGQAQTNDLGEFRIAGLAEGDYVLMAAPRPPAPFGQASPAGGTALASTYYAGTTDREAARVVAVASGQTVSGLQFSMIAAPAFQVSGVVVDEAGAVLGGAMIMLMPDPRRGAFTPVMAQAEPDGTFHIGGIVSGTYRITATAPRAHDRYFVGGVPAGAGIGAVAVGGVFVGDADPRSPSGPREVTIENADVKGLRIVVAAPK